MFPHSEQSTSTAAAPSISVTCGVTVTKFATRPTSLRTRLSPAPSPTTLTPLLDTPTITNILFSTLEGVQSGIPTRTTPTLTPTTLKNIEQLFEVPSVQPPESHFNQAGFVPPSIQLSSASSTYVSVDNKGWGGGVTTLTTNPTSVSPAPPSRPSSSASSVTLSPSPSPSPMPVLSGPVTSQTPSRSGRRAGGRRPIKDEKLSPEEEGRRIMRRERNKQAAARCRKRRLDQTTRLQCETDILEEKREGLQQEIQLLQQQREELEFVLAAHKTTCKRVNRRPAFSNVELEIKEEPLDPYDEPLFAKVSESMALKPPRPTSLALGIRRSPTTVSDLGISIETPSNGIRGLGLNFESMMEGGTGLTPVSTIQAPISTGLTPLTTPIVSTAPSSNCGTQQRSSSSELTSPDSGPPKLVSL